MKKLAFLLLLLSIGTFTFAGCGGEKPAEEGAPAAAGEGGGDAPMGDTPAPGGSEDGGGTPAPEGGGEPTPPGS